MKITKFFGVLPHENEFCPSVLKFSFSSSPVSRARRAGTDDAGSFEAGFLHRPCLDDDVVEDGWEIFMEFNRVLFVRENFKVVFKLHLVLLPLAGVSMIFKFPHGGGYSRLVRLDGGDFSADQTSRVLVRLSSVKQDVERFF